jgi:DNA-binding IclR family transcriptional regulator
MQPADEDILRHLCAERPDYLALVANRLGMHLGYVERRCDVLVEHGLVEPVSGEVVYRTTELGEQVLAGEVDATSLGVTTSD